MVPWQLYKSKSLIIIVRQHTGSGMSRHKDSAHLEELLRSCTKPRRLVVTDTLFSMDGEPLALCVEVMRL